MRIEPRSIIQPSRAEPGCGAVNRAASGGPFRFPNFRTALLAVTLPLVLFAAPEARAQGASCLSTDTAVTEVTSADAAALAGDCAALLDIKDSLRGTASLNWAKTLSIHSWDGIVLNADFSRVRRIVLENKSLSGTVPDLSSLTGLETLRLGNNALTGSIPDLSALTGLEFLSLRSNELTGGIPDLSALSGLVDIALNGNELTGSIPDLSALTSLKTLFLGNNELTGSIPDLSSLTSLVTLWLPDNKLTGSIPDLSSLTSLEGVWLGLNGLTGSIPDLSALTSLVTLSLRNNGLTGNIPDLSSLTSLVTIWLHDNELTGSIPEFSALTGLRDLRLHNNRLTGKIPDLSALDSLWAVVLNDNELDGLSTPQALDGLDALTDLYLHRNRLSSFPDVRSNSNLQYLYLSENPITSVPSWVAGVTSLQRLTLHGAELTGSGISDLSALVNLKILTLSDNPINSPFPSWLTGMTNLSQLTLHRAGLTGSIPDLSALDKLLVLYLHENNLSGAIPATLGDLDVLQRLLLASNPLIGGIPTELGNLNLTWLSLCETGLDNSATLPAALETRRTANSLTVWECVKIEDARAVEGKDVVFTVTRDTWPVRGAAGAATLDLEYETGADGDTADSGDYAGTAEGAPRRVRIPGNTNTSTSTSSATIRVPTIADDDIEPAETFTVTLGGLPASGVHALVRTATGTIGPLLLIEFTSASPDPVLEGGDVTVTITLRNPDGTPAMHPADLEIPVSALVERAEYSKTVNGRRVTVRHDSRTDIKAPSSVTVPANTSRATFMVQTAHDDDDGDESVIVRIDGNGPWPVAITGVVSDKAEIGFTIRDSGAPSPHKPSVTAAASAPEITEGGSAVFTITADRSPRLRPVEVVYYLSVEGDIGVADLTRGTVPFQPGGARSQTVTVATTDDSAPEPNGAIQLVLQGGGGGASGGYDLPDDITRTRPTVTVLDNDSPNPGTPALRVELGGAVGHDNTVGGVTLTNSHTVSENYYGEGNNNFIGFTIRADRDRIATFIDVNFTLGGTATLGTDYLVKVNGVRYGRRAGLPAAARIVAHGRPGAFIAVEIVNDDIDDPNETITLTVTAGSGYTLDADTSKRSGTWIVLNHDPELPPPPPGDEADALEESIRERIERTEANDDTHSNRIWRRALAAVRGESPPDGLDAMTQTGAQRLADGHADGGRTELAGLWQRIADRLGGAPDPEPEIAIAGGAGVTEGGDAVYTVTATPPPASDLTVSVDVSQDGDFGVSTGSRTVTVTTGGTGTLTVATVDDGVDEPDGSVTAALNAGSGYTVSTSRSSATVSVSDDDDPPVQQCVSETLHETVRGYQASPPNETAKARWAAVLQAFGDDMGVTAMTAAEAQEYHDRGPAWKEKWAGIPEAIRCLENAPVSAVVNRQLVPLTWVSPRDNFGSPSGTDYRVEVNGLERAVVAADLSGHTARLVLASPVQATDAVTVAYLGSAMHPLADTSGQVRSEPWDGLTAENLTGLGPAATSATAAASHTVHPLAAGGATSLDGSGLGLSDLRGVELPAALQRLDLSDNALTDLSPLAGLANLRELDLSGNRVTDLWALSGLHNLERLDLSGNAVTDVQALAGLSNLEVLLLDGNAVGDAWPLAGLERLETLGLSGNRIGDPAALPQLANLRRLDLSDNRVTDLSPLAWLGHLEDLDLSGNRVTDLWALSGLHKLERLDLSGNAVTDVQALASLSNLKVLLLDGNAVADAWPLNALARLENLGLAGNRVGHVEALGDLARLRRLDLSGNPAGNLSALGGDGSLE